VLVGENDRADEVAYITQHFATFVPVDDFEITRFGHDIYRWRIVRGEGYTPGPTPPDPAVLPPGPARWVRP